MKKGSKTLVVDSSYIARSIIPSERAFAITYKGNAEVLYEHDVQFKLVDTKLKINKPSVIRVFTYVNLKIQKVPLTRHNIFKRDGYECVYCGENSKRYLTLDHVYPRSKGGPNTWDNLVTACKKCNNEKDNLTLEEYGKEIPKPQRPHYLMLMKKITEIPEDWEPFLFLK